jgi:hypothetical protein
MNTYLSIDLDFWNFLDLKNCKNFMKEVKATNLPITLVDDHADLLKHINKRECSKVINIDYHTDICNNFDTPPHSKRYYKEKDGLLLPSLNCGTWANWVNNRESYTWLYPPNVAFDSAYCHFPVCDKFNPFVNPSIAAWKDCTKRVARDIPSWVFNNVVEIGIACSYLWLKKSFEQKAIIEEVFGKLPEYSKRKVWN